MSVGKYSPTVTNSYKIDQDWWERNGGGYGNGKYPELDYDDDGFDSYGYSDNEVDRAGLTEYEYLDSDDGYYDIYDRVSDEWARKELGDLDQYVICADVGITTVMAAELYLKNKALRFIGANLNRIHKDDVDKLKK